MIEYQIVKFIKLLSLKNSNYHNPEKHYQSESKNYSKSDSNKELRGLEQRNSFKRNSDQELDILDLLMLFWNGRKKLLRISAIFLLFGVLYIVLSRTEYQSSATLLPESQEAQSAASSLLSQYGGLIGAGGGFPNVETGITPGLYPDIIESLPYQVELMNHTIYFSELDTTMVLYDYFLNFYPPSTFDYLKKYTLGLPTQLRTLFSSAQYLDASEPLPEKINRDLVVSLTGTQRNAISEMRDRLTIEQEDGLITLFAEMPDPNAAAELGKAGIQLLKEYVREYRTQKANEELDFIKDQVEEAKKSFEDAQQKLAIFRDSNVNLSTAKAQTKEQELQSQYNLSFNLYNSLAQKLQEAKLRVNEETPVFTSLQPFQIPTGKSQPQTVIIVLISLLAGLFVSSVYILGNKIFEELRYQVIDRNSK